MFLPGLVRRPLVQFSGVVSWLFRDLKKCCQYWGMRYFACVESDCQAAAAASDEARRVPRQSTRSL